MPKNLLFSLKIFIWTIMVVFYILHVISWYLPADSSFKFLNRYNQNLRNKIDSKTTISSKNCQDGWRIDLTQEKDQDNLFTRYYTRRYLSFSKETKSLELTDINADISKYNNKGSSEENLFPLVTAVQKKLEYAVVDPNFQIPQTNYDNLIYDVYKADKIPFSGDQNFKTIYLSPDKFSQQEYKIAAQCYQENYAYFQGLDQEKEMIRTAVQVIVWAKPKDVLIQTKGDEIAKYKSWPIAAFECSTNSFVNISVNGIATLKETKTHNIEGKTYSQEISRKYLGYFDPNNQFINKNPSLDIQNCRDKNGKTLEQMFK